MPELIVIACPSCGAKSSLYAGDNLMRCDYCGSQFIVPGNPQPASEPIRPLAPVPRGVTLEMPGDGIRITRRWFNLTYLFSAIFAVGWCGFLAVWYGMAAVSGAPLPFFLFPLIHLAVGVGIGYSAAAGFLNHTTIWADRQKISIRHGPLPWFGNQDVPTSALAQLYCKKVVRHHNDSTTVTFDLRAVTQAGVDMKLLTGLDSDETALFMEQKMESFLGIQDRRVKGELAHPA